MKIEKGGGGVCEPKIVLSRINNITINKKRYIENTGVCVCVCGGGGGIITVKIKWGGGGVHSVGNFLVGRGEERENNGRRGWGLGGGAANYSGELGGGGNVHCTCVHTHFLCVRS